MKTNAARCVASVVAVVFNSCGCTGCLKTEQGNLRESLQRARATAAVGAANGHAPACNSPASSTLLGVKAEGSGGEGCSANLLR